MSHSEICPVCNGKGKKQVFNMTTASTAPILETCNGCGGCGWVTVQDSDYVYGLSGGTITNPKSKL